MTDDLDAARASGRSEEGGPDSRGGIATVMSLILARPGRDVLSHAPTYSDGSAPHKLRLAAGGLGRVAALTFTRRVGVVHAHMSFKGSVVRKGLALRIAQLAGVPTVLHAHSHGFTRWYLGLPTPTRWAVRTLLHADRWLVLGERWAAEYAHHLRIDPAHVLVLHNPTVPVTAVAMDAWPARLRDVAGEGGGDSDGTVRALFLGRGRTGRPAGTGRRPIPGTANDVQPRTGTACTGRSAAAWRPVDRTDWGPRNAPRSRCSDNATRACSPRTGMAPRWPTRSRPRP